MSIGSYILNNLPPEKYPGVKNEEVLIHYRNGDCNFDQVLRRYHYLLVGKSIDTIPGMDADDVYQELVMKLFKVCDAWKSEKEIAFSTYLYSALDNRIKYLIRNQCNTEKRKANNYPVSLDETITDEEGASVPKYEISVEFEPPLDLSQLAILSEREVNIVKLLLVGFSQAEVSQKLDLSRSRVSQICRDISMKFSDQLVPSRS